MNLENSFLTVPTMPNRFSFESIHSFLRLLCALCESCVFIFGTSENRGIAPSRKEGALTPRCCSREDPANYELQFGRCSMISVPSVFSVRNPVLSCETCQLKSWRSQFGSPPAFSVYSVRTKVLSFHPEGAEKGGKR